MVVMVVVIIYVGSSSDIESLICQCHQWSRLSLVVMVYSKSLKKTVSKLVNNRTKINLYQEPKQQKNDHLGPSMLLHGGKVVVVHVGSVNIFC